MSRHILDSCCQSEIPYDYLDVENHPTASQLEKNIGKDLTEIYFSKCTPIEKVLFGRSKQLEGPGDLWNDPEDRHLRMIPTHSEKMKALTHVGVLEIGRKIEEKNDLEQEKRISEAIYGTEELARFEEDNKIRFHVKQASLESDEECQKRINDLISKHEYEKTKLRKTYDDARDLLTKFTSKKFQIEMGKVRTKAYDEAESEMNGKVLEIVDREIANQNILCQEQINNTLKNMEINNRDRINEMKNQCLKAMDVQNHLMTCRHITEMMHMMTVQKRYWSRQISDMKNDLENLMGTLPKNSFPHHQSKSIKRLFMELVSQIHNVNNEELDETEKTLLDGIRQLHSELLMTSNSEEMTQGYENSIRSKENVKTEHDDRLIDIHCIETSNLKLLSSIEVQWEKIENVDNEMFPSNSFLLTVFNRFNMVRSRQSVSTSNNSSFEPTMTDNDSLNILESFSLADAMAPAVAIIPMPKTEDFHAKDSLTLMNKRVSIRENGNESVFDHVRLLSTVDSVELLNNEKIISNERFLNKSSSSSQQNSKCQISSKSSSEKSLQVPKYMRKPKPLHRHLYARMTDEDWKRLRKVVESSKRPKRDSSIQFNELDNGLPLKISKHKSSFLERSSHLNISKKTLNDQQNALFLIEKNLQKELKAMRIESVLMMLCDEKFLHKTSS
ncbi:CLUMA_CG006624, isoform A [Clunio marinus]|uniref:CLUMA_CG006624, isoform A n=1 Tax=Clunio marinus TaxID=568069 RepID=A0A1J1I045_9DIPT|nr:CLUMA_CG006624, isoform A [Clunio marinus]